ncbi:MAG: glycosyltransferase family 4 protein [Bacteroidetes bacterium]|nr:glycosyltransferase family 4 protein [Bacteroidota bacterium]MBL7136194.1 glycosyltransferase family 4 protein [Candidatus Neomarinimicrobiota bacterium]
MPTPPLKKVLIITYYWPPAGGPGVQRVLKFAKYLPEFGWQPIILTVKNGEYPAIDISLQKEIPANCIVYNTFSLEPNFVYKKFTGMGSDEKIPTAVLATENNNWKKRLANWIRLNIFIPDAKIGWIPFAVREGKKIIKEEKPDVIFSSSPPPTVHLIARKLAKWSGIKWVADFRDPWTDIYHYSDVKRSPWSLNRDKDKEKEIITSAGKIITVSQNVAELLNEKIPNPREIRIIPNGYDKSDFYNLEEEPAFDKFTIAYAGKINIQQNPSNLWKILGSMARENLTSTANFQILLMGNITDEVIAEIKQNNLEKHLKNLGYVDHKTSLKNLKKSHVLLLLIPNTGKNKGIVTGKLFEYIAIEKFILGIGPKDGDAAEILAQTNTGRMFAFNEIRDIRKEIDRQYKNWQRGLTQKVSKEEIRKYSRQNQTLALSNIFKVAE